MIEPLDPNSSQDHRSLFLLHKINELIDAVNRSEEHVHLGHNQFPEHDVEEGRLIGSDAVEPGKEPYCSQAEEALRQVAILEHTFDNHYHAHGEMTGNTGYPLVTMVDESKDQQ